MLKDAFGLRLGALLALTLAAGAGCAAPAPTLTATATPAPSVTQPPTAAPTATDSPTAAASAAAPSPIPATLVYPADWLEMPVTPVVSEAMKELYRRGLAMGNDPHSFSVVGDCQNVAAYFLEPFDNPGQYNLGQYTSLQQTIDWFKGSFARHRYAVKGGYNVASVISPLWADPEYCDSHESPLACEFRINKPSLVIISMETWWYDRPASTYASYLSQIVKFALDRGVVPILATKADNLEGDNRINAAIVQVAQQNQVPLWNFWAAVQPLPGHGLTSDQFHLRYAEPFFNEPGMMEQGWPVRNLTALQALDAVWKAVSQNQ